MNRLNILSIPVSTGRYSDFIKRIIEDAGSKKSQYTCLANVHMLVEAHGDDQFAKIVRDANYITPDGKPLTWAMHLLHGVKQDRVAGMDLLPDVLAEAQKSNIGVYFYGGSSDLLTEAKKVINYKYPVLTASYFSPPFRPLTPEEDQKIVDDINQSGAGIVFVVLGCPRQEKWMASKLGKIHAVMIGVGGALSVMTGMQKRAPVWMQNYGLEWLHRLALEPKRLFKRYLVTNSTFLYLLFREYLRLNFLK